MEITKDNAKKIFLALLALITFYWALQNNVEVISWVNTGIGLLAPIILGVVLAFIINIPMRAVEKRLFGKAPDSIKKFKRPVSLVIAMLLMISVVVIVLGIIFPQLINTVLMVKDSIPGFIVQVQNVLDGLIERFPELATQINAIDWAELGRKGFEWMQQWMTILAGSTFSVISATFSGAVTFVLALVLAIYVLLQKEKLGMQLRKILYAYLKEGKVDESLRIARIANKSFSNFFIGQCLEAVIIGTMFFVVMFLFKFPYALMISVTIGFTALIPIVGAFLGCIIGVFLILVTAPAKALWFVVVFLIVQQVEGNLIYPRVVGSSIGLPGIWVLIAVTVGGNLFGVVGMLIMVPTFAVCYTLLGQSTHKRLKDKKISEAKINK